MEMVEELQSSYAMKTLHFQHNVLECRNLFEQFSKQLKDTCHTFKIEIKGGKLPQPNIAWFNCGFRNEVSSERPNVEQNAGRLCSKELANAEENDKDQEREAAEGGVVQSFHNLYQNSTLYLVCTIFAVFDWLFDGHEVGKGALATLGGLILKTRQTTRYCKLCCAFLGGLCKENDVHRMCSFLRGGNWCVKWCKNLVVHEENTMISFLAAHIIFQKSQQL